MFSGRPCRLLRERKEGEAMKPRTISDIFPEAKKGTWRFKQSPTRPCAARRQTFQARRRQVDPGQHPATPHATTPPPRTARRATARLALGSDPTERAQAYRRWLDAGISPDDLHQLRAYARQERALGDERFHRMVETTLGRPATCRPRGRPRRADVQDEA